MMLLLHASASYLPLVPGEISDEQYEQLQTVRTKAQEFIDREDCHLDCCGDAVEPVAALARQLLERHRIYAPPEGQAPLQCAHHSECGTEADLAASARLRAAKLASGVSVQTLLFLGSQAQNKKKVWETMRDMGTHVLMLSPCASCGGGNASLPEKLFKPLHAALWDMEDLQAVSPDDLLAFNSTHTNPKKLTRSIEFVRRRVDTSVVAWSDALRAFGVEPDEAAVREVLTAAAKVV